MYTQRKRVSIRLPKLLVDKIDEVCQVQRITRTNFIEQSCRNRLNELGIKTKEQKELIYGRDWEL